MRFGPDVNASTSFDETEYTLTVPTDDPKIVDTAFRMLEDWAGGISFDPKEVDKERGVVLEEWRSGRGAGARVFDRQLPVLMHGSRYAERLPIGEPEILRHAPVEALRRFYHDWYRPDLMAVVAVGDFDPQSIAKLIEKRFRGLRPPRAPRERVLYPVPDHVETLVEVTSDPELSGTAVQVHTLAPQFTPRSAADYRRALVEQLHHAMLNDRFDEIRRRPDPPFLAAFSSVGGLARTKESISRSATVPERGTIRGLDALLTELERAGRHGFASTELDRAKASLLRRFERRYEEREKFPSAGFASEYAAHFLDGEAAPGIEMELGLVREFLPGIGLDEVNGLSRDWATRGNRVILVTGPQKPDAPLPAEAELLAVFEQVRAREVGPWVDEVRAGPLVATPPDPGTILEETAIEELGVTRWRLSNGVTVYLKPTDFKNDEVILTGFSPGGLSLVPDSDLRSAAAGEQVLRAGGLGEFSQPELRKALAGKVASASVGLTELYEAASGRASPRDLGTMFEMLYLSFTSPRADPEAFLAWKQRTAESLRNRLANPAVVFGDRMTEALTQDHPRRRPPTLATLDEIRLETARDVFRDRFANAGDFTFVIVGAFTLDQVRPLVLTYLGGLPATGPGEAGRDVGVRPPEPGVRVEVREGIEPKSQVRMVYTADAPWSVESEYDIGVLGEALRTRLREVLREDMGGTYGVAVAGQLARLPRGTYGLSISFGCAPENVDALVRSAQAELEAFRRDGPPEPVLEKIREARRREREVVLRENSFWSFALEQYLRDGKDPKDILRFEERLKWVTRDRVRESARRYLTPQATVLGILYPAPNAPGPKPPSSSP
jgi:zinc protease